MADNPFFSTWNTPFGLPPFAEIRPEHFPPAFERAMNEHLAEIEAIAGQAGAPDFANTVEAMERAGRTLERVASVFFNLTSSATNDELDEIALAIAPKLALHHARIAMMPALVARVFDLHRRRETLDLAEDQARLLDRIHKGLLQSGAALAPEGRERMTAILEQLATLHTRFGQNVLADEKAWSLELGEADLDGLPEPLRAAAGEEAARRGLDGRYVVTLSRSSVEPFLTFSARRDLRQTAYLAWAGRGAHDGPHDNRPLIKEIVALRTEQAKLLGFESYAAFKLDDTMAGTVEAARGLLLKAWEPAKRRAAAERAKLEEAARILGLNEPIAPWDWRYFAEKVRLAEYDLDEAELKPYFQLETMVEAIFDTAKRLFGVSFRARPDLAAYHEDVAIYEAVGEDGQAFGLFLQDNFARPGKHSGAWMSSFRDQSALDGWVSPVIINNNNLAKGAPTLLSFDDARTLFHEFGHGLHGLLSRVRYPSQAGTSVKSDFVEFPSQVMENWLSVPDTLRRYARHAKTGQPLPDALLKRLLAARTFNQGFATVEYTAAALFDLAIHDDANVDLSDIDAFEAKVRAEIGAPDEIALRHRPAHFGHLFSGSGYAAGYYSYLWAEVLDADGFAAFEEAGDAFEPGLARRLKDIYAAGDTKDPMALYRAFRGRDPKVEALLEKRGLAAA